MTIKPFPLHSRCTLEGSELAIETVGDPVWIRQYPIPEGYQGCSTLTVQGWIDQGIVVSSTTRMQMEFTTVWQLENLIRMVDLME